MEPAKNGEFDVAIGAQVRSVDGQNICLVDDDNKVSTDANNNCNINCFNPFLIKVSA